LEGDGDPLPWYVSLHSQRILGGANILFAGHLRRAREREKEKKKTHQSEGRYEENMPKVR
jgi:hypothetical protein